jgi:hypothetical protein
VLGRQAGILQLEPCFQPSSTFCSNYSGDIVSLFVQASLDKDPVDTGELCRTESLHSTLLA